MWQQNVLYFCHSGADNGCVTPVLGGVEMVTRELVKEKIDHVQEEYLDILYKIVQSFEADFPTAVQSNHAPTSPRSEDENWHRFVALTYGSTANAPIERGEQGKFEIRETFE